MLPGSQKCGRIEHVFVGGQQGADLDRVNQINDKLPINYVEMAPGKTFFHLLYSIYVLDELGNKLLLPAVIE